MIIIDDQLDALYGFNSKTTNIALKKQNIFFAACLRARLALCSPSAAITFKSIKNYIYHDQLKHENHDDDLCPCISGSLSLSGHRPLQVLRNSHILYLNIGMMITLITRSSESSPPTGPQLLKSIGSHCFLAICIIIIIMTIKK